MADPKTFSQEEYDELAKERDALRAHNKEVLDEAKAAKKKLKDYDGVDPEKYKQLENAAIEAERKKAAAEGDFKSLESQLKALHATEIAAKEAKASKLYKALEKRAIRVELTTALTKAGVLPDMLDLMVDRGERSARMKETEDDYVAFIADEKGNQLVSDSAGTAMDFGTFVEKDLKTKYPRAFEGTGSSGSGASKSAPSGGGAGPTKVITKGDNAAFLGSLDDIISGKTTVSE